MRDTSDMMEDTLSEDTMMDCGGDDGGTEDFDDLAADVADSTPTIRDAAERLLTLLGMDEDNEDLLTSSEDEGVEVDIDELEDDDEEAENSKLLRQLAVSLAQEFKLSRKRTPSSGGRTAYQSRGSAHSTEMAQNASYHELGCLQDQADAKAFASACQSNFFVHDDLDERYGTTNYSRTKLTSGFGGFRQDRTFEPKDTASLDYSGHTSLDRHRRMDDPEPGKYFGQREQDNASSWTAGWDACATEALRYLVEDEGLPLHHPAVVAMKNHLDLQRERTLTQYADYAEAKSQDMNLVLD